MSEQYGVDDASYRAAGGWDGLEKLAKAFYRYLDSLPEAAQIRALHGDDLVLMADKLACFLSGWLGGPRLFSQRYGSIAIPSFHAQWPIGPEQAQAWLLCMEKAIAEQPYSADFAEYLLTQLRVPAARVVQASAARHTSA